MARPSDIIVVGAGIVGCAVAHELASRGASVEIVDERPVGMGATQASAGVLAPYIEAREGSPLLDLTVRSLESLRRFVERVTADSGIAVAYRRTGTLDVATNDAELRALQHDRGGAGAARRAGADARRAGGARRRAAARRRRDRRPADRIARLRRRRRPDARAGRRRAAHGAQLVERSRVRRISSLHGDMIVDTDRGSLTSNAVVLAAGSWSGAIDDRRRQRRRVPVRPVRGQLLHLGWTGTPLRRVTWSARCYLVPWDDGTLLVGATVEEVGFDERTTVAGVRDLLDAVVRARAARLDGGFLGARVGLRPATADELPVIGASAAMPNLMYATGHYRNGVLLAPLTAQLVADAMLDNRIDPLLGAGQPGAFW